MPCSGGTGRAMGRDGAGRRWACSYEDAAMKKGGDSFWKEKKKILFFFFCFKSFFYSFSSGVAVGV
jgi:hypothetical protein